MNRTLLWCGLLALCSSVTVSAVETLHLLKADSWKPTTFGKGEALVYEVPGAVGIRTGVVTSGDEFHAFESDQIAIRDWSAFDRVAIDILSESDFSQAFGILLSSGDKGNFRQGFQKIDTKIPAKTLKRVVMWLHQRPATVNLTDMQLIHFWMMEAMPGSIVNFSVVGVHGLHPGESLADLPLSAPAPLTFAATSEVLASGFDVVYVNQDAGLTARIEATTASAALWLQVTGKTAGKNDYRVRVETIAGPSELRIDGLNFDEKRRVAVFTPVIGQEIHENVVVTVSSVSDPKRQIIARARASDTAILTSGRGHLLYSGNGLTVHSCMAGDKVGRQVDMSSSSASNVTISLAANEREGVQVVLRQRGKALNEVDISVSELRSPAGGRIPVADLKIEKVCYVQANHPTSAVQAPGAWPDPLLPVSGLKESLAPDENSPYLITVFAKPGTKPGRYAGTITISAKPSEPASVPLVVEVLPFELPKKSALQTCFGLIGLGHDLASNFNAVTAKERAQVRTAFLENFAEHRVSPVNQNTTDIVLPPITNFTAVDGKATSVTIDFTNFDKEMGLLLDHYGFNTQCIPLEGVDSFGGWLRGTPEHTALWTTYLTAYEEHLIARGWIDQSVVYIYDEPSDENAVRQVQEVYGFIKRVAPRIHTISPILLVGDPRFIGKVSVWCPLANQFDAAEGIRRAAAGDLVWWYHCWLPKPPVFGLYIDAPSSDMRAWGWQSWRVGASGILMWTTVWWNGTNEQPGGVPEHQVWKDAMSYMFDGTREFGNGDGRFIYPPPPGTGRPDSLPCNSLRWEAVRDGIEDYDYMHEFERLCKNLPANRRDQELAAMRKAVEKVFPSNESYGNNQEIYQLRAFVVSRIVALQKGL